MVKLITVATHADGYFKWLKLSCQRYNIDLVILGWGEKWKGFAWRSMLVIDYLKTIDENEIICFIDAYDVILLRPLHEIVDYYKSIVAISNKKVVLACDHVKSQTIKIMAHYIFDTCKDIAVNAGTYIGNAKDVGIILNEIMINNNMDPTLDDQKLLTEYCNMHPELFYIDQDSTLFLTIENPLNDIIDENVKIIDNKLFYMGSRPFFIHANGNGKLDNIIKQLGYMINDEEILKIDDSNFKAVQKKVIYYSKFYYDLLMMMLILIILFICIKHHQ